MLRHYFHHWYEKLLMWSQDPKAPRYLAFISFIDASLFPISPLFMLLPMSFAKPHKAFSYAWIVISTSFMGGIIGYGLGYYAYESFIAPFIQWMGYAKTYQLALTWLNKWGYAAIIIGCMTPFIPYKIFTIGAGVTQLSLSGFLIASFIGRMSRFLLIATVIRWGGPKAQLMVQRLLKAPTHTSNTG